ncbi:MAG: hypothetical protein ABIC95_00475 [archaeon]
MGPQNNEARCVVCDEAITNPICPECIEKSVKTWLVGVRPQLIGKVENLAEAGSHMTTGSTRCIQCGQDMVICPHCFSRSVQELIEDEGNPYMEEEFLTFFDYDLRERPYFF